MKRLKYIIFGALCALPLVMTTSCSDEPDKDNFYTFTGEMMSDYINNRAEYSDFAYIVDQADLTDLLSAYGHYTCFLPSNTAMQAFLQKKGLTSVEQLTKAQCDTIARTHLVNNIYATIDMNDGTLNTANMNKRYLQITHTTDANDNSVVQINRMSNIIFELKDDSVENGIVQPIDVVIENSNSSMSDVIKDNDRLSIFYEGLLATGLRDTLLKVKDETYNGKLYDLYFYKSHIWSEVASAPEDKKYGFTVFVEPDEVYLSKFDELGISTAQGMTRALYDLACKIYDPVYGNDADYQAAHDFDKLTERYNPLNMFIAYHILTRDVIGWNLLTPLELHQGIVDGAIGIKIDKMNPNDWYETLLPHSMMKLEQATVREYLGNAERGQRYINRRVDEKFSIDGSKVLPTVEDKYVQDAPNGRYFYIDKIIAYDNDTREKVMNDRIRMDFATVFPEIMTMNIRFNGNPTKDDDNNKADLTFRYGKNYYFPNGYLDNVTMKGNGTLVYRRPHWNFWSYEGDEFNLFGDYDLTFRLPPVPYEGDYQIRLGFCALDTRGVAQIYFDGKPQGIPLDMRKYLNDKSILGDQFGTKKWAEMSDDEKAEDQKMLKNLGYYRGAYGGYHSNGSSVNEFVDNERTYRLVLCTVHINPKQDHFIRIRCTSSLKLGNNNEFMMDYLEIVPKSVYGVTSSGSMETDL